MKKRNILLGFILAVGAASLAAPFPSSGQEKAEFREYPIGDPVEKNGLKIVAVWLPPVKMEGMDHAMEGDMIHLEADIHAAKGNKNGFGIGEWIPYLTVNYALTEKKTKKEVKGKMVPMVAKDGPHYGASIHMPVRGTYELTYEIRPPSENGFGRHTDPVTGVEAWWEPFTVTFTLDYHGAPK